MKVWVLQVFTLHQIVNSSTIALHASFDGVQVAAYSILFSIVAGDTPTLEWNQSGASHVAQHVETGLLFLATPMMVGE